MERLELFKNNKSHRLGGFYYLCIRVILKSALLLLYYPYL